MYIGYVQHINNASFGNSVKVEHGGLLREDAGIRLGVKSTSQDNRLILGPGGTIETPYVRVGLDGALSNAVVFAGGSITADELTVYKGNAFIVEASLAEFVPSEITSVTLEEDIFLTPVDTCSGIGNRVFELLRATNITGHEKLRLAPGVNPRQWKLAATATEITLTRIAEGSLVMVR